MTLSEAIVYRISKLKKDKSITTNKLANLSGLTQSTVRDITHGISKSPRINTILHICEGLNISLKDFFNDPIFDSVLDEED